MIFFGILFLEITIMFLLSRATSKALSRLMSINFLSILFLPGVIIHELSHMLIAVILFVPVGDMEFMPRASPNGVKLGSVEIAKTDPIRRSIIGFAPVFTGLAIIIAAVYFFNSNISFFQGKNLFIFITTILVATYLLFAISNTMFSSGKDMEGTVEILITLVIIFAAIYILGFRPSLDSTQKLPIKEFAEIIKKSSAFLLVPIVVDLLVLGIIKLFTRSRSRIF